MNMMNKPKIKYDEPSDSLIISFISGVAATGIELNDQILLKIDKSQRKAVSLTIHDFSYLAQKTEYGARYFPMTGIAELPGDLRELVLEILNAPPVNEYISVSTYNPTGSEAIPITSIHYIPEKMVHP